MDEIKAITVHSQSSLDVPGFMMTTTGLIINGSPSFEEWEHCGRQLGLAERAIHWAIGDWWNYGERSYGEMSAQAVGNEDGFKYQTLKADKWVSICVPMVRRRTNLSWSHHREVAPLEPDDQDYWLDLAEQEGLTRNELRKAIRQGRQRRREKQVGSVAQTSSLRLIVSKAENMPQVESESVDLIITSPPYNLGGNSWPMGGDGRTRRDYGIGYDDEMQEQAYQEWQLACLNELYRVAKHGASFFYNHKVRNVRGAIIHPMDWLGDKRNPWTIRQEIIWDRGSTHNHSKTLFWPEDERIYWMTKGKPILPDRPVGISTVWRFHGPVAGTWHPAPFSERLPEMCIMAIGRNGITVLDPFAGSCTTCKVALKYGYKAIGVDVSKEYLGRATKENGWIVENEI